MTTTQRAIIFALALPLHSLACERATTSPADALPVPLRAQAVQALGELIYRGEVFDMGAPDEAAQFRYERWVRVEGQTMVSTHLTYDAKGREVVSHRAEHTPDYRLARFDLVHSQVGTSGRVEVAKDGKILFTVKDKKSERSRSERGREPVVVGPTLFGFTLAHLDELLAGESVAIRFAVVERARSYRCVLRGEMRDDGTIAVTMTASNPIVRWSMGPTAMFFDMTSRQIVRYQGPVPPQIKRNGSWKDLKARVDYEFVAAKYR